MPTEEQGAGTADARQAPELVEERQADVMPARADGAGTSSIVEGSPSRIVPAHGHGLMAPLITKENAREMAAKRWQSAENIALRALRERGGGKAWGAGWLQVIEAQLGIATSGGKGSTPAAVFVGRAAGLLRERTPGAALPEGAGAVVVLSESATAGVAAALASYLKK